MIRGIGTGDAVLPDGVGGEYVLQVFEEGRPEPLASRKILVNEYRPEVFFKKLEFDAKSYGPGDVVQAKVEASKTAGGPLGKGALASVDASLDGTQVFRADMPPNKDGVVNVRFNMPKDYKVGIGSLAVTFTDGSESETIVRPIPAVGKKLEIEFYPEGGDLIAGVENRVYMQARLPGGKPADLSGVVTDGTKSVADVKTDTDPDHPGVNRGIARFSFTPQTGKTYFLKVDAPAGIEPPAKDGFKLPEVKADGVVLTALADATERGQFVKVRVQTPKGTKKLQVGAYARGRLVAHKSVELAAGNPVDVDLEGDKSLGGVTRVTVFEEQGGEGRVVLKPVAERLVYRKPAEKLSLEVGTDKSKANPYVPGDKVTLDLKAFTEGAKPTGAILMVAVVNQSVVTMADDKTERLMPTHFLLAGEVRKPDELEHADFLLDDEKETAGKAAKALDFLLGTQGWRRFAEQSLPAKNPADQRDADTLLVANGIKGTVPLELSRQEEDKVNAAFQSKLDSVEVRVVDAEDAQAKFQTDETEAIKAQSWPSASSGTPS